MSVQPRSAWGARPPKSRSSLSGSPGAKLHYNGPPVKVSSPDQIPSFLRGIQNFHMNTRGWSDIAYSVAADPFGQAWELRGRGIRTAANGTNACNSGHHAIFVIIGDGETLTDGHKIAISRARQWLGGSSHTGLHQDCKATSCPGSEVINWLRAGMPTPGSYTPPSTGGGGGMARPTLRRGAKGNDVQHLQNLLNGKGHSLTVDGDFGPATEKAVKDFQGANGLASDGIVGPNTWAKLEAAPAAPPAAATHVSDLFRINGGAEIYVGVGGYRIHIPDPATFDALGYDWSRVADVPMSDPRAQLRPL